MKNSDICEVIFSNNKFPPFSLARLVNRIEQLCKKQTQDNTIMIIKMEQSEEKQPEGIMKKVQCPEHELQYMFKCEYPNCDAPFICSSLSCIDQHLHEGRIVMSKFKVEEFVEKLAEVQKRMYDDTISNNARVIKSHIDELKESIKNFYTNLKTMNQNYDYLKGNIDGPLTFDYLKRVNENYELGGNLATSLEELKSNVKLDFPLKDSYFSLRNSLVGFLSQNIQGFSWSKCDQIYSSKHELINCQSFHQKLVNLCGLIFIFIGESMVIGSYYSCAYPSISVRSQKDKKSFIFISKDRKFLKYTACENAEQHLSISEKTYICQGNTCSYGDGIRTFHKNFDALEYCLPSNTYELENFQESQTQNGTLKVKKFMILQFNSEQIEKNGLS